MSGIQSGEIWWADLPEPRRSQPGYRRPVLVVQADCFNLSRIQTVIVVGTLPPRLQRSVDEGPRTVLQL